MASQTGTTEIVGLAIGIYPIELMKATNATKLTIIKSHQRLWRELFKFARPKQSNHKEKPQVAKPRGPCWQMKKDEKSRSKTEESTRLNKRQSRKRRKERSNKKNGTSQPSWPPWETQPSRFFRHSSTGKTKSFKSCCRASATKKPALFCKPSDTWLNKGLSDFT